MGRKSHTYPKGAVNVAGGLGGLPSKVTAGINSLVNATKQYYIAEANSMSKCSQCNQLVKTINKHQICNWCLRRLKRLQQLIEEETNVS